MSRLRIAHEYRRNEFYRYLCLDCPHIDAWFECEEPTRKVAQQITAWHRLCFDAMEQEYNRSEHDTD